MFSSTKKNITKQEELKSFSLSKENQKKMKGGRLIIDQGLSGKGHR